MHALALIAGAALLSAGAAAPGPPTVTRLVRVFSELETGLLDAVRAGEADRVGALLGEAFEMRTAAAPSTPVPRAEWTRSALGEFRLRSASVSEMAARDLGPVVVVSFRMRQEGRVGSDDATGEFFVVDTWSQEQGPWRLQARYVDAPGGRRALGAAIAPAGIEKKY